MSVPGEPKFAYDSELEIKFVARSESLAHIAASLGVSSERKLLQSTYFDTADLALWRQGFVLRMRDISPQLRVQCVKSTALQAHSSFHRTEIEVAATGEAPDFTLFSPDLMHQLIAVTCGQALIPRFTTSVMRQTLEVRHAESVIEVSVDEGEIIADGQIVPLCEIELELKSGPTAGLFRFAVDFAQAHGLILGLASKSERGFRLVVGAVAGPVHASSSTLRRDISLRAAIVQILSGTLQHFTSNWAALEADGNAETVHQLRVSLRRMRSAFAVFKPVLADTAAATLGSEARTIADGFAPVRKSDVFHAASSEVFAKALTWPKGTTAFREHMDAVRRHGLSVARDVLRDPATTAFVIRLELFMAELAEGLINNKKLDKLAKDFAPAALARFIRRARKSGKSLSSLPPNEMHKLRVTLKKLRYGIAFLDGVLSRPKHWQRISSIITNLQDSLGARNDAAELEQFLAQALGETAQQHAEVVDFLRRHTTRDQQRNKKKLDHQWKDFRKETEA